MALERGPLVYCAEGVDNPELDLFSLSLPRDARLTESPNQVLGGVVLVRADARDAQNKPVKLTAIPYNVWANRQQSAMRIWFSRKTEQKQSITTNSERRMQ